MKINGKTILVVDDNPDAIMDVIEKYYPDYESIYYLESPKE